MLYEMCVALQNYLRGYCAIVLVICSSLLLVFSCKLMFYEISVALQNY